MNRSELEHLLRASRGHTGERDFIIIGSQSVLGKHPDAPRELRQSMESSENRGQETHAKIRRR